MKKKVLSIVLIVLLAVLAAELAFVVLSLTGREGAAAVLSTEPQNVTLSTEPSVPGDSQPVEPTGDTQPEDTQPEDTTGDIQPEDTQPQDTTEATQPTELTETSFLLTFTGDSTIGCAPNMEFNAYGYTHVVGEDYEYPFRNVAEYFRNDDLTLVNLESVLAEKGVGTPAPNTFVFRAPTAYVNILTSSSVEAVTLANNHYMDYGDGGYASTKQTLADAGVTYVEQNGSAIYTTESGLVVGLYAAAFLRYDDDMRNEIADLRSKGAQLIVAAMHWGNEGQYRPTHEQKDWAHTLIDAGVDIVWGHHSHVLQPIEEYNGGIIYYSLANFTFGGNTWPRDPDTAVLQQEVILGSDGSIKLGKLTIIPCRVSSADTGLNNYQPTPYEEGSAGYDRVMSKLEGTWTGPDLTVEYGG